MSDTRPIVGVLGLQGDIEKHLAVLERLGARGRRVLAPKHLDGLVALVLPGGESTTMSKGLARNELVKPIQAFAEAGGAVLGTCAGAILLARASRNHPVPTLGLVDVEAERNAYGTQLDSFVAPADPGGDPAFEGMECVFIRAPRLLDPGPEVEVLLRVDGEPVLVRQGRRYACTFHPELTDDLRVHAALLEA
ncbi:MAG: pyridoxal 5'-phosphate synthase glutaminase subunit PdxT [Spirochaetaceae bacterium]|nr:pyridoxal 5'-phosphate synthase glutaminase subunit PdxT [Myxococcales bacterium]MCB9723402.1 pyridoxal 5'-phosphate synthase glutaminase subunit PdxT [Spirochaetaceae bacterium]